MVLAADAQVARSILLYQNNVDKISHLTEDKILACGGPQSDCVNFREYIAKNIALYELNNNVKLTNKAAANFIRGEVKDRYEMGFNEHNFQGVLRTNVA